MNLRTFAVWIDINPVHEPSPGSPREELSVRPLPLVTIVVPCLDSRHDILLNCDEAALKQAVAKGEDEVYECTPEDETPTLF